MYLVCPPDQTLPLPPTESTLWHQLDIVNSSDYATSFTPVRKAANGRLEFQFGLGRSQVFVTSQSRLTGEGSKEWTDSVKFEFIQSKNARQQ